MYTNVCVTREIYKKVKKKLYFFPLFVYHIIKIYIKFTPRKNYENFMDLYVSLKDKKYFEPTMCTNIIYFFYKTLYRYFKHISPHKITNTSVSKFSLKQSHMYEVRSYIYLSLQNLPLNDTPSL